MVVGVVIVATALVIGCGSDEVTPKAKRIALNLPKQPSVAECGLTGRGSASDSLRPPARGTYAYRTVGRSTLTAERRPVKRMPKRTTIIVTAARRKGAQSCYTMQHRYENFLVDNEVFVISGRDTSLRSEHFAAGVNGSKFHPNPSLLYVSDSKNVWSGEFRGRTSGNYKSTVMGYKQMRVAGKPVSVVGIETRIFYTGQIDGYERSKTWFAVEGRYIVSESVAQARSLGMNSARLRYSSRLVSIIPTN